ncbi:uncharacterized protein LOC111341234 isoform X4 [Stylophora pistillata]|uniref:uncharacterized protein LOC111341234 isoform X4 n=1 Tax=Stylophora pistillata TaxID=50429 RepID=UPI000C057346|nr:uncharacterized protein LOC111341234 isoform X4 [Stylophora pistillata]
MVDDESSSSECCFGRRVIALQNASCAEEEIVALKELRRTLLPTDDKTSLDEDDCEKEWLRTGFDDRVNPFPTKTPETCIHSQKDLDSFTFYLFERRFGWSEFTANIDGLHAEADEHLVRRGSSGSVRIQDESKFKAKLNELLDEFLKWYLAQVNLTGNLLKSFKYTVTKAHNMPVVRNQTFVHIMDWLKLASSVNGVDSKVFPLVKDVVLAGITDIWSAIRNTCVAKFSKLLELFTMPQVEEFYQSLVKICLGKETSWQAKEGAVMCMTAVVCQFLWSGVVSLEKESTHSEGPRYMLKFGLTTLTSLPEYIMSSVHSVLFSLLVHPQLIIREHSTKAISAILSRCEFEVALSSFQEVINRLCHGTQEGSEDITEDITEIQLPHHAVFRQHFKFLKAHEAEGLLGVCIFLIKHIPPGYLLPKWPLYFSTLNLYLMHPASTVRQATSVAFKYLVAKDSNNPVFLKLVLQGLAADWKVEKDLLMANLKSSHAPGQFESSASSTTLNPEDDAVACGFESQVPFMRTPSPISSPDLCYVSVDSSSNVGPEAQSGSSSAQTGMSPVPPNKSTRTSIRQVAKLLADDAAPSADFLMSESWEWREGRLLAYELIIKFLITNHIHYVFPTYVLPVSKASASSSSVDETLINRSKSDVAPKSHPLCVKSNSFGVINSASSGMLYSTTTIKEGESSSLENIHERTESVQGTDTRKSKLTTKAKPKRAASVAVEADTHTKQLIRQYSVATPHVFPKRPFRLPKTSTFALGNSLLNQTKALDAEQPSSEDLSVETMFRCLKSPFGWSSSRSGEDSSNKVSLNLSTLVSDEVPPWTNALQLGPLSSVLSQVFLQTVECLADTRWELRRMGQQVLPLATEVVRWFDMKPLEILWDNFLSRDHTLLCYGSCIALRYSVLHAGRLMHFLEQPPPNWKDPESCGRAALTVVEEIKRGLKRWLHQVYDLFTDSCFDKLSVVAMETIMMSHICFPYEPDNFDQKLKGEEIVLNKILVLYAYTYPESPLGVVLAKISRLDAHSSYIPPSDGFLSFSTRAATVQQHALQASKFLIAEVHSVLPRFLKDCDADQLIMIFPVLVHYIAQFFEDSAVCRALLDGLYIILYRVEEMHMQGDTGDDVHSLVQTYLDFSLLGLRDVINTKELELQVVREVLEVFIRVCIFLDQPTFLSFVFKAISNRLDYEPDLVRLMSEDEGSNRLNETPDLLILSNDIPTSPAEELIITGEDEEDPDAGRVMQESVALDTSHESSRGTTRLPSPEISLDNEEFSDWDSWEDENENETVLMKLFSEFLRQISQVFQSRSAEGYSVFREELLKCGDTDQKAITNIMSFQG